jgi:hypothetical protein
MALHGGAPILWRLHEARGSLEELKEAQDMDALEA